jgi:hypothetical protein
VRHGADEAAIYVELDGGKLTIDRTIGPTARRSSRSATPRAPCAVRRRSSIARRRPVPRSARVLALPAKEQRAQLMKLIPDADRIDELDGKRSARSTAAPRSAATSTKAEGELARLPETKAVGAPIDVAALNEEVARPRRAAARRRWPRQRARARAARRERDGSRCDRECTTRSTAARAGSRSLERSSRCSASERRGLEERAAKSKPRRTRRRSSSKRRAWRDAPRASSSTPTSSAPTSTTAPSTQPRPAKRRDQVAADVAKLKDDTQACTKAIETIDQRKAEILAAAKLPVDGLAIDDDGIALAGVPFAQASASERLRVALALAIAGSPGLGDVWIRDGALLDDDALELVAKHAAKAGKRVWIERVGTKDPGVIVIKDGEVSRHRYTHRDRRGEQVR